MSDEKTAGTLVCNNCGTVTIMAWREAWGDSDYIANGLKVDEYNIWRMDCCNSMSCNLISERRIDDIMLIWNEESE